MQKVYILRLMPVYIGLTMFAAYFFTPANHYWSIIVHWLAACIALRVIRAVFVVYSGASVKFAQKNPSAMGSKI
jgi:hypothetical protein